MISKEVETLRAYLENFRFIAQMNLEYLGLNIYPGENPLEKPRPYSEGLTSYTEEEKVALERIYLAINSQIAAPVVKVD